MLIHRCYILWGSKKIVLWILGVAALTLNGISSRSRFIPVISTASSDDGSALAFTTVIMECVGWSDPNKPNVFFSALKVDRGSWIAIAGFDALLSLATGGRIWWISREVRQHMGPQAHQMYKAIVVTV
ncbi:hypothetical protein PQX77_012727 [Marasmius sp. AFHP31]|nr:hypothetical protein PQX77_012727 [Marasmius sp. AFHP31]